MVFSRNTSLLRSTVAAMAAFASRLMDIEPDSWLGSWDVLRAGTLGGAALLGMAEQIGRIAPGYKADIAFVDLTNVAFVPLNDAAIAVGGTATPGMFARASQRPRPGGNNRIPRCRQVFANARSWCDESSNSSSGVAPTSSAR